MSGIWMGSGSTDNICDNMYIATVIYPSNIIDKRGKWHYTPHVMASHSPLFRNRIIVDKSHFIIACPKEDKEILRSGTWATIRYAKKLDKEIYIVFPNGEVKYE